MTLHVGDSARVARSAVASSAVDQTETQTARVQSKAQQRQDNTPLPLLGGNLRDSTSSQFPQSVARIRILDHRQSGGMIHLATDENNLICSNFRPNGSWPNR